MKPNFRYLSLPIFKDVFFSVATLLFLIPRPYLTVPQLDSAWQASLEEAFFKEWEFGTTVVFTGGPLNFLYSPTTMGYYVFGQIATESLILFLAIFLIYRSVREQVSWIKVLVYVALIMSAAILTDGLYLASIAAGAFVILQQEKPRWSIYWIPTYMVVLGLMKFTFALLGIGCILTLAVGGVVKKEFAYAGKILGTYVMSFLFIWILIGQNLMTIPAYFINSLHISQGYLWSMHRHEEQSEFFFLIFYLLLVGLPIFVSGFAHRRRVQEFLPLVIAAGTIFLSWKASIIRAGSHLGFFLQASLIVTCLVHPTVKSKFWSHAWIVMLFITYLGGMMWIHPLGGKGILDRTTTAFQKNLDFLTNPFEFAQKRNRVIPLVVAKHELPKVKKYVGNASIDVLHYQHSILLLNDLNFHPRPTIQNYPAYNHHLLTLNLRHMMEDPPQFILVKYGSVDYRYPYCDDTLYNREVFQSYEPVLEEKGYILLQRASERTVLSQNTVAIQKTIKSGENVDVSAFSDKLLWLQVDYRPSFLHRLLTFFYKPEILWMRVTIKNGTDRHFRLVAENLGDGFLLNPLLEGNAALEKFLTTHQPETKISSFAVESSPGQTLFSTQFFDLKLWLLKSQKIQ